MRRRAAAMRAGQVATLAEWAVEATTSSFLVSSSG